MTNSVDQYQNMKIPNYSGVNIQIFNPTVTAEGTAQPFTNVNTNNYNSNPNPNPNPNPVSAYPANYYTNNFNQLAKNTDKAKSANTKKIKITKLTDEYIKSLEDYLNSQDKEIRTMAAKEVFARMKEDISRKNDPVLMALNNKMLKDPSQPIRFIAMGAIEGQFISGDIETIEILNFLKNKRDAKGQQDGPDSIKASKALLQLTKTQETKEVEG